MKALWGKKNKKKHITSPSQQSKWFSRGRVDKMTGAPEIAYYPGSVPPTCGEEEGSKIRDHRGINGGTRGWSKSV